MTNSPRLTLQQLGAQLHELQEVVDIQTKRIAQMQAELDLLRGGQGGIAPRAPHCTALAQRQRPYRVSELWRRPIQPFSMNACRHSFALSTSAKPRRPASDCRKSPKAREARSRHSERHT